MEKFDNSSKLLEELIDMYIKLDFNNPDEVANFIYRMTISEEFVSEKAAKAIALDLREKGITDYKEYEKEHGYIDKYNNVIQYYFLHDNKKDISGNLLSRYLSSLEFLGKPNILVNYLAIVYRSRFIDYKDKDKYEVLRNTQTFNSYIKYHK